MATFWYVGDYTLCDDLIAALAPELGIADRAGFSNCEHALIDLRPFSHAQARIGRFRCYGVSARFAGIIAGLHQGHGAAIQMGDQAWGEARLKTKDAYAVRGYLSVSAAAISRTFLCSAAIAAY